MVFAFSLVPLVTAVGAAVDYSRVAATRDRLTIIADAAALEAISKTALQTRRGLADYGKTSTENLFRAQAGSLPDVTLGAVTVAINQTDTTRDVSVQYSAEVRNYFGSFLIGPTTTVAGRSVASTSMPVFMNFYVMLDNSPSMGLGATLADIRTLENNTPDRCAFACHQADKPGTDYYALAKSLGVTTRMDVVRQATQALIDTAMKTEIVTDQFRVGIYTFAHVLQEIAPVTADLQRAKDTAGEGCPGACRLDQITVPYHGANQDRYTDFDGLIPYVSYLPQGGSGFTASSPKAVLFLVTDAVADEPTPGNPSGRTLKPIPLALCDAIKNRNIQIAALYTTYYPLPTNGFYNSDVAPFQPKLGPTMSACASSGLYFEVSPTGGIAEAMQALFKKAVGEARLSR